MLSESEEESTEEVSLDEETEEIKQQEGATAMYGVEFTPLWLLQSLLWLFVDF